MRWQGREQSENYEDRRASGGPRMAFGGGGIGILVLALIVWLLGGIFYSNIGDTLTYYLIGIGVLLLYIPLYYYRTRVEDKRSGAEPGRTPVHAIHEK